MFAMSSRRADVKVKLQSERERENEKERERELGAECCSVLYQNRDQL